MKPSIYLQKGHLPSQKTEAQKWSGPCYLYQGPTADEETKERFILEHTWIISTLTFLKVRGYAEASVWGGRDERGVRRQPVVAGEGGYGCYLLGMASQLLQPFSSLSRNGSN